MVDLRRPWPAAFGIDRPAQHPPGLPVEAGRVAGGDAQDCVRHPRRNQAEVRLLPPPVMRRGWASSSLPSARCFDPNGTIDRSRPIADILARRPDVRPRLIVLEKLVLGPEGPVRRGDGSRKPLGAKRSCGREGPLLLFVLARWSLGLFQHNPPIAEICCRRGGRRSSRCRRHAARLTHVLTYPRRPSRLEDERGRPRPHRSARDQAPRGAPDARGAYSRRNRAAS